MSDNAADMDRLIRELEGGPDVQQNIAEYDRHFQGLRQELHAAGYSVRAVSDLLSRFEKTGKRYRDVVPLLAGWAPRVDYMPLREDILRALAVPWASAAAPELLAYFHDLPSEDTSSLGTRWLVGLALAAIADDTIYDDLVRIAVDRSYGEARWEVVEALGKFKRQRPVDLLVEQLDDPSVAAAALSALSRLKATEAINRIAALVEHLDPNVRRVAKRTLKKLGQP